jgi:hypothetical protein
MRGARARKIQELAGHQDLMTPQRYMHRSPAALDAAIRLLEAGPSARHPWSPRGGGGNRGPECANSLGNSHEMVEAAGVEHNRSTFAK